MLDSGDRSRLKENLAAVRARIAAACARCGRDPAEVRLVAVTKYAGADYARSLVELGQHDLGENRVDRLQALSRALGAKFPARWHMVGHLQRNKARKVASLLHSLHSLDRLELAERLDAARDPSLPPLRAYLQVRLDPDKPSGIAEEDLPSLAEGLARLTRVRIVGLMGMPPAGPAEAARPHFARLRHILEENDAVSGGLSMGMSGDLEVAVEEGATVVRIGRALLAGLPTAALEEDAAALRRGDG